MVYCDSSFFLEDQIRYEDVERELTECIAQRLGLQKGEMEKWVTLLRDYRNWAADYQRLAGEVRQCAAQIEGVLNAGYLRSSQWAMVRRLAQETLSQFSSLPTEEDLAGSVDADFVRVLHIVTWTDQQVEAFRSAYVERLKAEFSDYFDSVENNPLTESQRNACVIDEDNNLVLAGAGTGKTSTMVARAGFLIQSGQAKGDEILMLAFADKAAKEMQDRLDDRVGGRDIVASTFHKLGKDIIAEVEGAQPSISPLARDDEGLAKKIDQWFKEMLEEPEYKRLVLDYFGDYMYPAVNPFDFKTEGEYFAYIAENDIRTLKGERVKSLEECLIANHLFKLGVEYKYEANYEHETRGPDFRQYQPDFYLTDYGIYLEHLGIDRRGNTAPFVNRDKYHKALKWKRDLHKKHGTCLIETYHYEFAEGGWQKGLEEKLTEARVVFDQKTPEEMLNKLSEFGAVKNFVLLLRDLVRRLRNNLQHPDQLQNEKIRGVQAGQFRQMLKNLPKILSPIYDQYQALLEKEQAIDFDDMINRALMGDMRRAGAIFWWMSFRIYLSLGHNLSKHSRSLLRNVLCFASEMIGSRFIALRGAIFALRRHLRKNLGQQKLLRLRRLLAINAVREVSEGIDKLLKKGHTKRRIT